jgi:hypothetical protein
MRIERYAYMIVWFVPTLAAVIGGAILMGIENKIRQIDDYLRSVEAIFVVPGWEFSRRRNPPRWLFEVKTLLPWIVILIIVLNSAAFGLGIAYEHAVPLAANECGV